MTKEDLTAIEELADMADGDNPTAASIMLRRKLELVPADIAYQLTRIADGMDKVANPLMQVDKDGVVSTIKPKPAPDAGLVEAVKEMIAKFESAIKTGDVFAKGLPAQIFMGDTIELAKKVQSALAAHKPEVDDVS